MELGLRDKAVLITGASKGIGEACAWAFAAEGCRVYIAARNTADLERVADAITKRHNVEVQAYPGDLTHAEDLAALAQACRDVDVLVNNAGAVPTGPIERVTDAEWRSGFDLKVFATVSLTREIYMAMCARRRGVVVNIIGNCGERPDPEIIIATIANTGLMGFTRALGAESPNHGVRIVGINPGPTETERLVHLMQRKSLDRTGDAGRWRELVAPLPFGRPATPAEVADMVVFAASDRASFVSGAVLTVDGGVAWRGRLF